MYNPVIYLPQNNKKPLPSSKMQFGFEGTFTISYPKNKITPKSNPKTNNLDSIEMDYIVLEKGTNHEIIGTEWENAISQLSVSNPSAADEIKTLVKLRVITVYQPDEGKSGRNSVDFSNFNDLTEIISHSRDRQWLSFSLQVERRSSDLDGGDVQKLLSDRLQELDDEAGVVASGGVIKM